jgi:type I restriction enzyme S subunit
LAGARRITREHFVEWTRKAQPSANDVILSRRCNPGETAFVPPKVEFALGQNLVLLRADGTKVHSPFLRWLVRGPEWWEQIGKFLNVGAVFDSLKCADVPNFELRIPPMEEQRAIAHILGTLDERIELNRRMNETLESIAHAMFRSWFIDFDPVRAKTGDRHSSWVDAETLDLFPDELEESHLGQIPAGWAVSTLKELVSKIGSGATPRGGDRGYVAEGIAFIRSQNVYDSGFAWEGLARISDADANQLRGVTVQRHDVLLNITGASILRTCLVDEGVLPARVNQHVAIVRAREGVPASYLRLHLLRPSTKRYLLGLDAGGSRQAVTKGHIESVPVLVPSGPVLRRFGEIVDLIYAAVSNSRAQGRSLASIRDTLLPKLLSGGLRIKDRDRFGAEATA